MHSFYKPAGKADIFQGKPAPPEILYKKVEWIFFFIKEGIDDL